MIWFNNFKAYRLADFAMPENASDLLHAKRFDGIGAQDANASGFIYPRGNEWFAHEYDGAYFVALRTDTKVLPASVVNAETDKNIKECESELGYQFDSKAKKEIKEMVIAKLLPQAFAKTTIQRAIIDTKECFVYVEGSSATKTEEMLSALREALGSLPTRLIETRESPCTMMTMWVEFEEVMADNLSLGTECELRFPGDGGAIAKFKNQALEADDVQNALKLGKIVTKLGMTHRDRVAFTLTDELTFCKVQMLDILADELEESDPQDESALFDASLAILVGELRDLVPDVIDAMGGEAECK